MYKLTVTDTVEERILDLQEKKRQLAEQAIEGGMKKGVLKLGINEIIDLFKPTHQATTAAPPGPSQGRYDRESSAESERRGNMMRRKPAVQRQESEIYGRRW